MVQRYGIFLNNQTFLSLFSKLNWLFLLIVEIFINPFQYQTEDETDMIVPYY